MFCHQHTPYACSPPPGRRGSRPGRWPGRPRRNSCTGWPPGPGRSGPRGLRGGGHHGLPAGRPALRLPDRSREDLDQVACLGLVKCGGPLRSGSGTPSSPTPMPAIDGELEAVSAGLHLAGPCARRL
ncbi:hypothetical protein LV779_07165 [Streptomyces thinghirensis]|nr:hypothetical protein [Streptomyces thinghirensis]